MKINDKKVFCPCQTYKEIIELLQNKLSKPCPLNGECVVESDDMQKHWQKITDRLFNERAEQIFYDRCKMFPEWALYIEQKLKNVPADQD